MLRKNLTIAIIMLCASFCLKAQSSVQMIGVTDITGVKATFTGQITNIDAADTYNSRGFVMAEDPNLTVGRDKNAVTATATNRLEPYSYTISTLAKYLKPSKTYYVAAWMRVKKSGVWDTVWSDTVSFTTTPIVIPEMSADSTTEITIESAKIHGTLSALGDYYSVTGKGFVYGLASNPTLENGTMQSMSGSTSSLPQNYSYNLTGLQSGRTYYYRMYCIGKIGSTTNDTSYSEQKVFITPESCDSIPYGLDKTNVDITEADLFWKPRKGQANFEVDYGIAGHTPGEGTLVSVPLDTICHITGLQGGRSYSAYVRAVCSDSYSDWSQMTSFTTLPPLCADPQNVHLVDLRYSSAVIGWTPGSVTQDTWEVLFVKANEQYPNTPISVYNQTTFSPIGLTANTTYKMKVRANCDPYFSEWSDDFEFKTAPSSLEDEVEGLLSVKIFPNPSEGKISFDQGMCQVQDIEVYNSTGARVYSNSFLPEQLDLSAFGKGIYFVHILTDRGYQMEKILVK